MKLLLTIIALSAGYSFCQQIGDPDFKPVINNPFYSKGEGPVVQIDEAHNNFHTLSGRYKPFADVLESDGYILKPNSGEFKNENLIGTKILVISNALNERNSEDWTLPTLSAFTGQEIDELTEWVKDGGSLFLIADHMPFPGAAHDLAERFGFELNNGFAGDTTHLGAPDLFTRMDGTLNKNIITNGRNEAEFVDSIYSFTGESFRIPANAIPVLILNENFISMMPDTAWNFTDDTPKISVAGWSQGAVLEYGKGKVAMWGEAAMFSAQVSNNRKIGMNSSNAKYNMQLLLNIIHWLDGSTE